MSTTTHHASNWMALANTLEQSGYDLDVIENHQPTALQYVGAYRMQDGKYQLADKETGEVVGYAIPRPGASESF